jgi:hypothetical protein
VVSSGRLKILEDTNSSAGSLGVGELKEAYRGWVEESLEKQACERQPRWTESIAVGSEAFVKEIKEKLGIRAPGRKVIGENGNCELREVEVLYKPNLGLENNGLSFENTYYWDICTEFK